MPANAMALLPGFGQPSVLPGGNRLGLVGARSELERLPRQKLPGAAVLHPDLHHADLRRARLSSRLDLGGKDVAGDGVVAGHADGGFAERDRLVDGLLAGDDADVLGFGLDLAAG